MSLILNKTTLTFIAFVACPVLGLVSAVMGLILILGGNVVAGVIFLVLITQVFIIGGVWATRKRSALLEDEPGQ